VPADDNLSDRLFVSHLFLEALENLKMALPPTSVERRRELRAMRKQLKGEI
jgi:hypothetical protein